MTTGTFNEQGQHIGRVQSFHVGEGLVKQCTRNSDEGNLNQSLVGHSALKGALRQGDCLHGAT